MNHLRLPENQNVVTFDNPWEAQFHMLLLSKAIQAKISLAELKQRLEKYKQNNLKTNL